MKNNNLIQILKTFDAKEIKELGEFVRSEFFNRNQNVIKLYSYLAKCHPDYAAKKVSKEEILKKVFSGSKYNDSFVRKVIFNLTRLTETYITYKNSTEDKVESKIRLLAELNKRKIEKSFAKHFAEIEKENEASGMKNHIYYRRKFALETQWSNYVNIIRYKIDLHDKKESYNERIGEKLKHFINYFLFHSMDTYRSLKFQGYIDRFDFNNKLMDNVIDFLLEQLNLTNENEDSEYISNLTIRLYLYEIMLMRNKSGNESLSNDTYFGKLKNMLKSESHNLLHDSRFSLYNILLQHCSNRIMRGFSEYRQERYELDMIALEQGIYKSYAETKLPPPAFASFVRDASEMKEFGWAFSFIQDYKDKLDENNYETIINFSSAILYFNKGEFQLALDQLNKIRSVKRWEFKFAVKELTLQIYFELNMFTQAYYLIDSYRHFITSMSKNFSEDRIESRINFVKYYTRLLKLKENRERKELKYILKEFEDNNKLIFNRDWLKEKICELDVIS